MSRRNILAVILMLSLVFAFGAFAADYGTSGSTSSGATDSMKSGAPDSMSGSSAAQMQNLNPESAMIGKKVVSSAGEDLGEIRHVVKDPATGTDSYSLIAFEDKLYPVPISALQTQADDRIVLNVDKSKFASAPSFSESSWPDLASRDYGTDIYNFYGLSPHWESGTTDQMRSPSTSPDSMQSPSTSPDSSTMPNGSMRDMSPGSSGQPGTGGTQ
jgi:hypothetical protein